MSKNTKKLRKPQHKRGFWVFSAKCELTLSLNTEASALEVADMLNAQLGKLTGSLVTPKFVCSVLNVKPVGYIKDGKITKLPA
jgi:hypothetical protein